MMKDSFIKSKDKRLLLIDADVIVYQACASAEKIILWEEDLCFPTCNLSDALTSFNYRMDMITKALKTKNVLLCFSGDSGANFRKQLYPPYKSNRIGKPRPVALKFLTDYIKNHDDLHYISYTNLEADDVMGILATDPTFYGDYEKIIVTVDKDLKGIPCSYYNIGKPEEGVLNISEEDANYWWFVQALKGDTTDGYGGCPKYGDKTAEKALIDVERNVFDLYEKIIECYEKAGLTREYATIMTNLARILRYEDYNKTTGEVIHFGLK